MDDTAQKQNQTNDNVRAQVQPRVPVQPQQQPQPQVAPVGTTNKEIETAPVSDYVKPSEKIVIDKEVTDAGIVEAEREIKIEEEHEKMGVRMSAESTPVKTEPTGAVQLPMDEKEARKSAKKGPGHNINLEKFFEGIFFADSVYGLAVLMLKHLKRIHKKLTGQPA
ncbi:MAG TPA: hypothetical protein VMR77_00155 [Patescibacteria group bacterium]|jgi:hypothetical protein|nr:hypothetical protein [Patescibacteria group bacterium]